MLSSTLKTDKLRFEVNTSSVNMLLLDRSSTVESCVNYVELCLKFMFKQ